MASKGETTENRPASTSGKRDKGTVKSVLSGDTIVVLDDKPSPNGPPAEKIITLSSLQAPRFGRNNEADEDFAFESREFLRKKVVGKKIQYLIDHSTGTREYVTVFLAPVGGAEPECVNHSVVAEGWARLKESTKKSDQPTTLETLRDAAVLAGKGVHAKDTPKPLTKNNEDADTLFKQLKGKPLTAIVEQVRTGTSVKVTILPSRHSFQVLLSGAQSKGWKKPQDGGEPQPEPFAREAKFFVENHVLQRDVTLTIEGIAPAPTAGQAKDQIALTGSIEFQNHDVAEELLKAGLASYVAYSAAPRGAEWVTKLKNAEKSAKDAKRRLWTGYESKSESNGGAVGKEFNAKVINVQNNATLVVIPEGGSAKDEITINLSSIKVPRPPLEGDKRRQQEAEKKDEKKEEKNDVQQKRLREIADTHWSAEGKEVLRKRLIGQKVRVVHDYTRKENKDKKIPERAYHSVYQNDQNLAVVLVESGLAEVNVFGSPEDRSADFEVLIMAEKKAKAAHRGVHTPVEKVPARRHNDLCVEEDSEKRAARAQTFLTSLTGSLKAVVEHVFSGARFKLTVPKQSVVLFFTLAGIRVPKRGETGDAADISDLALTFARERLHQLEVNVDFNAVDKGGNFIGNLYLGKKNFATALLEAGLAEVHFSADRLKDSKEFYDAEKAAKEKKIGMWKNWDEEAERAKAEAARSGSEVESRSSVAVGKPFETIITEVVDGARFYMQVVGPESAGLEELVTQLTELSVTEGTGMPLLTPKVGEVVRGQFTADDRWYRAKVVEVKGDKYKLQYIDYGNSEIVPASRIRALPPNSETLPAQAQLANLAFIKPLGEDNDSYGTAKDDLRDLIEGKKLTATIEYRDANVPHLTLLDGTVNVTEELLKAGNARLLHKKRNYSNPAYVALKAVEEEAKRRRYGIWWAGDIPDSDEDEKDSTPKRGGAGKAAGKDAKGAAAAEKGGKKK